MSWSDFDPKSPLYLDQNCILPPFHNEYFGYKKRPEVWPGPDMWDEFFSFCPEVSSASNIYFDKLTLYIIT